MSMLLLRRVIPMVAANVAATMGVAQLRFDLDTTFR